MLLVAAIALRLYQTGGLGVDATMWGHGSPGFLVGGIAGTGIVASAISLTNFVRHPEISGRAATVEAHYDRPLEKKRPRRYWRRWGWRLRRSCDFSIITRATSGSLPHWIAWTCFSGCTCC